MTKCKLCRVEYPSEILHPFENYGLICGICALRKTNEIHGTQFLCFSGELAETYRQAAIDYLTRRIEKEN
jgi:hypothetical protein